MQSLDAKDAPLYSTLASDPDMNELVEMFVDEMPGRVDSLNTQEKEKDWEGMARSAHQLKGSGGGYGFEPITTSAAKLVNSIRSASPEEQILASLGELLSLCRRARAGAP